MSNLGKKTRLQRIFRHSTAPILTVAVDHMILFPEGMPQGIRDIQKTVREVVEAAPHAITMNKGVAMRCMPAFAGQIPLIVQGVAITLKCTGLSGHATVEEVVGLGADAIAIAILVKGPRELENLQHLGKVVTVAERFGLPVITHIYPVVESGTGYEISYDPEDVFFAARAGFEMGADMVKTQYTGDEESFRQIVSLIPVPVVAAGGPQCQDWQDALERMRCVGAAGAAGATVGRNAWGQANIARAVQELTAALVEGRNRGSHGRPGDIAAGNR